jgi:hypothetical protein
MRTALYGHRDRWKGRIPMSKSNAVVLVTLFAAAALIVSVVPATAASSNCAVLLVPGSVDPSGTILATEVDLGCYPTYAEALAAGSSGAIDVPALTTPASLTDAVLAADTIATAAADVLIGTEFTGIGYGGSSKSYFASATCSTGVVWGVADVGASWDNQFSSGKGFGGCDTNKKFENTNFGGSVLTCTPNCTNYGTLSNQVSSLRWKP